MDLFTLINRKVVKAPLPVWAVWFDDIRARRIRVKYFADIKVSTVFIGIEGQLFETMIFGLPNDYQTRCDTHREALAMHRAAVNHVKDLL